MRDDSAIAEFSLYNTYNGWPFILGKFSYLRDGKKLLKNYFFYFINIFLKKYNYYSKDIN